MIKRKIYARLEKLHEDGGKYALLVDGAPLEIGVAAEQEG